MKSIRYLGRKEIVYEIVMPVVEHNFFCQYIVFGGTVPFKPD